MSVIREDTVKLGFDFDDRGLNAANDGLDDLLDSTKKLGGGAGDAEDGFDDAAKAAKKFGDSDLSKLSDGIDKIVSGIGKFALSVGKTAVKGIATLSAAGAAGLVALGTQSVKAYAEYEQLIGGVETLFGNSSQSVDEYAASIGKSVDDIKAFQKANGLVVDGIIGPKTMAAIQASYSTMADASETVIKNANDAYKTAGLSANEYMETVTSFSASLISSLGGDTAKAANIADQAIVDMSDNANKMGTDMGLIQNAYQGFAKQNYTMLDNLKLGYGGTKEEMQRLLKDAEKLTGQKYDISNFADIVEAIHAIQTEMGITGTTAKEASETIQGSALAMKAAWANFITGMADENADFDQLFDNLIDSVITFADNLIPRIKKMLPRLIRGLTEIGKSIGKYLPEIMADLVPELARGVRELLGSMWDIAMEFAPMLKKMGLDLVKYLYEGFTGKKMDDKTFAAIESRLNDVLEAIRKIVAGCAEFGAKLLDAVGPALLWIGDMALKAFTWIGDNIDWLLPVLGSLLGAMLAFKAVKKVTGIVSGFMSIFGKSSGGSGGLLGGGSGGGGGLLGSFANLKPTTVLKGIANIAMIVGALAGLAFLLAWAAPKFKELTDAGSLAMLLGAIGAVGLLGTGMAKLAGMVGNIPVATVAKGLADIAIIMVGLGALAFVLGWASNLFDFDIAKMLKLLGIIGAVGIVGSALAGLAGLIGMIPVAVVLTGLENIALAIGGFSALIAAFAALSMIDGFDDFMTRGGETLANICRIIGEMAGSIIGGVGEGITNSLPTIGENISAFATAIEPAMSTFSGLNFDGMKSFASAFGQLVLVLTGEKIASWFTGGIDYAQLGSDLTALTTNGAGFFEAVQNIPETAFANATKLFQCLNGIGLLPNSGGVVQWFKGEVDYEGIATGLNALAGTTGFFAAVQEIPEAAFTAATNLFNCLSGIGSLPKSDGLAQWFTGEVNYQSIADGLAILGGDSMIAALNAITGIPAEAYASLTALFDALAGIKQMPKEGGIFGWFTGDNSSGLTNVSSQLPTVAENIASFFTNLGGRTDFSPIKNLFDTLSSIEIDSTAADKGFLSLGSSQLETMGSGLSSFATNAKTFFDTVNGLNIDNLSTFFDELGEAGGLPDKLSGLDGTIGTTLSNMVDTVETGMNDIKTKVSDGMDSVVETVEAVDLYDSGVNMMNGLINGIGSKMNTLLTTVRTMAATIKTTINDAMKINSPSKVTFESGAFIGQGLVEGMRNTIPEVKVAAKEISTATVPYSSGYTPESTSNVYNSGGNSEYTTISPVFNLTISGSQDDRSLARKVKRFVKEAVNETFESMDYTATTVVREV